MKKCGKCAIIEKEGLREMAYYTYILRCCDDSLYAGITTDVSRRMEEHFSKGDKCAKYTRIRGAKKMEAAWESENRASASRLEFHIKRLAKAQKERLITRDDFTVFGEKVDMKEYRRI